MSKYKKRKDGRYLVQIPIGYQDNGKPKYKNLYGRTIAELDKKVVEFKADLYKGIIIDDENLTLGQWAEHWVETYKTGQSYSLEECHRAVINNHLDPIKNIKLSKLKPSILQEYVNTQAKERNVEYIARSIKGMLKQAVKNELIFRNPMDNVTVPKSPKEPRRALTEVERKALLNADLSDTERTFAYLCLYAGLRRNEALALMINDIDFKNNIIRVNKTLTVTKNGKQLKAGAKTEAGNREIPIIEPLKTQLQKHLETIDSLYVFTNTTGGFLSNSSLDRVWKRILRKMNVAAGGNKNLTLIKDITPHFLRHTYATDLFYAGIDLKSAQYLMGHASIKITLDLYTHLDKDNDNIAQKLQKYINLSQSEVSQ